jgi:hypothetical protein
VTQIGPVRIRDASDVHDVGTNRVARHAVSGPPSALRCRCEASNPHDRIHPRMRMVAGAHGLAGDLGVELDAPPGGWQVEVGKQLAGGREPLAVFGTMPWAQTTTPCALSLATLTKVVSLVPV